VDLRSRRFAFRGSAGEPPQRYRAFRSNQQGGKVINKSFKVNPVIRGKANYFLTLWEALKANEEYGLNSSCYINVFGNELKAIDGFIRRRLRVCMIHKHPSQRKGWAMTTKWNIEFFVRIGLIATFQYYYGKQFGYTPESYVEYMKNRQVKNNKRESKKQKNAERNTTPPTAFVKYTMSKD
jgi:hypothetical protein